MWGLGEAVTGVKYTVITLCWSFFLEKKGGVAVVFLVITLMHPAHVHC